MAFVQARDSLRAGHALPLYKGCCVTVRRRVSTPPSPQLREHGVQLVHIDTVQFTGQMCVTQESHNVPLMYGLQQLAQTLHPAVALHTFGHVALLHDSCSTAVGHGSPPCSSGT